MVLWISLGLFVVYYLHNRFQSKHTVIRNYPIIGPFRYALEELGVYLRQYWFAQDREELPFNRAQRQFVYKASKNASTFSSFGSTQEPKEGVHYFTHALIASDKDTSTDTSVTFGSADNCTPYTTDKLFHISGMSFGAISAAAVDALSIGSGASGVWLNTGEGGLSKHHLLHKDTNLVFQIGTAKYGVQDENGDISDTKLKKIASMPQVKMFEIKLSQGAKPGKGGILPGKKVTDEIAEARGIPKGSDSYSPNKHKEIEHVDDIFGMVKRVRDTTNKPVGIKLAIGKEEDFDDLFQSILKLGVEDYCPDFICIDGGEGGTAASSFPLMDGMGMSIKEALPLLTSKLSKYSEIKARMRVIASGKMISPLEVAWALALGADCVVSARGFMFALGCIQALKCSTNKCPTGITTHDKKYTQGLIPARKGIRVKNYAKTMHEQLYMISESCGLENPSKLTPEHLRIFINSNQSIPIAKYYNLGD